MLWQTKNWGEMLINSGQVEKIISIGGFQIEKRSIGYGFYGLFVIGVDEDFFFDNIFDFEKEFINICKRERAIFAQIEPISYFKKSNDVILNTKIFNIGYYKKFIMPYTALIELNKDEEQILSEMKPKGRYNIRLAEKKGIVVKIVEKTNDNIEVFYNLMNETTSRNKFNGNSLNFYKILLSSNLDTKLFFAYKDSKVLSGLIFVRDKDIGIYYYGVSTSDKNYTNLMSPYLLQWEVIKYAKSVGCKIYDFLGIAQPENENSPLLGVTDFKLKLAQAKYVSNSYLYVQNKFIYLVLNSLRKLKKIF